MADVPKVGINGFGRIGRLVARALLTMDDKVDLVGVNDVRDGGSLQHLFKHDSIHGPFPGEVEVVDGGLSFGGDELRVLQERDPARLPWKDLGAEIVIESTGHFSNRAGLQKHIDAGAEKAILTAPGKDLDVTLVRGVNSHTYDPERHHLVSNASCTTNCLAPVLKVLNDAFGVQQAFMTTVHAYTNDQQLLDAHHADVRRSRAAGMSMIPTSTGAASAIGDVLPELDGKVDGISIRVPTPNVSLVDLTARLEQDVSVDRMVETFKRAERDDMKGILRTEDDELVSVDFNHDAHSAVVDVPSLMVVDDSLAKVLAWYDNEWAFSMRVAELMHEVYRANGGQERHPHVAAKRA